MILPPLRRTLFALSGALLFSSCGDFPFGDRSEPDPLAEAGCYRVRIRQIACFDGCAKWWEVKNVCYDRGGNWVESNGLNIKYGVVNREGLGLLSVDTMALRLHWDAVTGRTDFTYLGFAWYKQDTVRNVFSTEWGSDKTQIYGTIPAKLACWEFVVPDSLKGLWDKLSIPRPDFCPKTIEQILDSARLSDKTD